MSPSPSVKENSYFHSQHVSLCCNIVLNYWGLGARWHCHNKVRQGKIHEQSDDQTGCKQAHERPSWVPVSLSLPIFCSLSSLFASLCGIIGDPGTSLSLSPVSFQMFLIWIFILPSCLSLSLSLSPLCPCCLCLALPLCVCLISPICENGSSAVSPPFPVFLLS